MTSTARCPMGGSLFVGQASRLVDIASVIALDLVPADDIPFRSAEIPLPLANQCADWPGQSRTMREIRPHLASNSS